MRIDAHVHGDSGEIKGALQTVAAESRAAGIERVGYIGEADDVLRASRESPDFIIPIAQFDMDQVKAQETHDAIDEGAVGVKFIDPQFSYGDTRYDPLYAAISDRKRVAVFHTGYLSRDRLDQPVHTDMALMRPAAVDCLSRRHPDLTIIMAHYGNP